MSEWLMLILAVGAAVSAVQAIRTPRLLHSALWLAGTSALVALMLYGLGAAEVAVIELSVGAGLVTVLFVFAINIAGDEGPGGRIVIPRWLAWGSVILAAVLLAALVVPSPAVEQVAGDQTATFAQVLWHDRGLDVLVQIVIMFAGALGVLGLLGDSQITGHTAHTSEVVAGPTTTGTMPAVQPVLEAEPVLEPAAPGTQVPG